MVFLSNLMLFSGFTAFIETAALVLSKRRKSALFFDIYYSLSWQLFDGGHLSFVATYAGTINSVPDELNFIDKERTFLTV